MDFVVSEKRRAVWDIQLDMLDVFKAICRKYDLHYCAFAGTLLGAMRHQGYIPWDDDIDLLMPREDYEKFLVVAKKELKVPFDKTTVSVPNGAVDILNLHFGSWKVPVFNGSAHGDIFYDLDKPYTEYLGRYHECHGDTDDVYVL